VSDDLDIRSGGAIAVDTGSLRAAASRFDAFADDLDRTAMIAQDAATGLAPLSWVAASAAGHAQRVADEARRIAGRAREKGDGLRAAATVYESAEIEAQLAAARAAGDTGAEASLSARQAELEATFPGLTQLRDDLLARHGSSWREGLLSDALAGATEPADFLAGGWSAGLGLLGTGALGALLLGVGATAAGVVKRDARLAGGTPEVTVRVTSRAVTTAPMDAAAALARIPGAGDTRVRVERYQFAGGERQFVVYVAGTQTALGPDPWDNRSNVELYSGNRSASYAATAAALHAAGARTGDIVHAVGHSQGAMIAGRLALEGGFDTRLLLSAGSPIDADVAPPTLSVNLRHADDPVTALASGGHAHQVGAEGSVVVERDAHAGPGVSFDAHHLGVYIETAERLGEASDPRLDDMRDVFERLGGATLVTAIEFTADRPMVTLPHPRVVSASAGAE
jgi:hypothetical protein